MPTFRQRPLTWLFVIATVCVDVALAAPGLQPFDSLLARAVLGFMIGQMFALGGWLALGEPHRLLRAGVYVAAVLALTTLTCVWVYESRRVTIDEWGLMLVGVVVLLSAIPALVAGVTSFLEAAIRGRRSLRTPVRFPVVELLGWMIVVAVASAALRFADVSALAAPGSAWIVSGGSAVLAGLIYALLNHRDAPVLIGNLVVCAVLAITFVIGTSALTPNNDIHIVLPLAYAYMAAWIGAGWLDKHALGKPLPRENGQLACLEGVGADSAAKLRVADVAND